MWHRRSSYSNIGKPVDHFVQLKSAIETITKLRKVTGQVLFAYSVVCTVDGIFDVPDHGVHPSEDLELIVLRAATGNDWLMTALGLLDSRKAVQAVGDNKASGAEVL